MLIIRFCPTLRDPHDCGLLLDVHTNLDFSAYCDSYWSACPLTRRSLTGYLVTLGGLPILWMTKKQTIRSRSPVKAKYREQYHLVDLAFLCSFQVTNCRHIHKGTWEATISVSMEQVGHGQFAYTNLWGE